MSAFRNKPIGFQTIGDVLREERERQKRTLEEVAARLAIRREYLAALEHDELDRLPPGVYGRRFVEEYARLLRLKPRAAVQLYEQQLGGKTANIEEVFGRKRVRRRDLILLPRWVGAAIIVLIIMLGFAYLGLRIQAIIAPPALAVTDPPAQFITSETAVTVSGTADPETRLFINDTETVISQDGTFTRAVTVAPGLNTITIRAQKRYGRDAVVVRQVLVK